MNIKTSQDLVNEANQIIETLDTIKVKSMLNNNECILIDVRDIRELWREGTIKNAKHIPRGMLEFWLDPQSSYFKENNFNPRKKIILYCALGMRSALATKSLVEMGHKNVAHVNGGFDSLKQSGLEVVTKEKK